MRRGADGLISSAPMDLASFIRDVPDFPKPGIVFKDITPLLADHGALSASIEQMAARFDGDSVDCVVGIESRGFIFGTPLAMRLGASFVPTRKPGKLPYETHRLEYELEYGTDALEIHKDAISPGAKVLVVDDLLATGGTLDAACRLVEQVGGTVVGCALLIELAFLPGRAKVGDRRIEPLIRYD